MSKGRKAILIGLALLLICVVIFMFIPKDKKSDKRMTVTVGDKLFTAVLYDNRTADELYSRLPLTLDMRELNGNEKYIYTDMNFTISAESVGHINKGELMLYGDSCVVLFYDSFDTPYSYTRLGYIENAEGLENAVGPGSVTVSFNAVG